MGAAATSLRLKDRLKIKGNCPLRVSASARSRHSIPVSTKYPICRYAADEITTMQCGCALAQQEKAMKHQSRVLSVATAGLLALVLAACGHSASAPGPSGLPELRCTTPEAPDGAQPPCNPAIADSAYPTAHLNNYAQDSTLIRGPEPGEAMSVDNHPLPGVPIAAIFSPVYPDGRVAVWFSTILGHEDGALYKFDAADGSLIASYNSVTGDQQPPSAEYPAISRTYGFLDHRNRLYRASGQDIEVLGDIDPTDSRSKIARLAVYALPEEARCRENDYVVGVIPLWNGQVGFSTNRAMIGVFTPDRPEGMKADLTVYSINGAERCADASISDAELETTSNNPASDETHAIYPITDGALYRIDLVGGRLKLGWRAEYETGTTGGGGVRLDSGSGSSPTLMGNAGDRDRFVVITDGAPLMNLVLMWRDEIPAGWQPIAPGKDPRIACELPIDFGDPTRTSSQSEQSVVVRGYASYVPNNQLRNTVVTDAVLQALATIGVPNASTINLAVAGLLGGVPVNAPHGFERIDWEPTTRSCKVRWVNKDVSIPNGVPFLSVTSGIVYGIGQRNGVFGLEGMSVETGESVLWVPGSALPTYNSYYTALNIGPDGAAWTGGFQGFTVYRPQRP